MQSETGWFDRLIILRTMPGLRELPPRDLAAWAEHTVEVRFKRGDLIHEEGRPIRYVYLLAKGSAELRLDGKPFRRMTESGSLGALACFARLETGQTTIALEDCTTLRIEFNTMLDLFEDNFAILRTVFIGMAREALSSRLKLGEQAGYPTDLAEQPDEVPEDMNLVERMAYLKSTMNFSNAKLDPIAEMAADASTVQFQEGDLLWTEGEIQDFSYSIIAGVVRCEAASGQVFRLGPRDSVGTLDSAAVRPRWYTAVVEQDLVALKIPAQSFTDIFEDYFLFALDVLEMLSHAIIAFQKQTYREEEPAQMTG